MASSIKALRMYTNDYGAAPAAPAESISNALESTTMNKAKFDAAVATFP